MDKYCAISIICRNENQYLKEWIDYHLLIGFDHIQIWDNDSRIPIKETVKEYIDNKTVSVKHVAGLSKHRQCYTQSSSVRNTLRDYKWIALIDTDEFIVLLDKDTNIKRYLEQYEDYGAVGLNWLMFNSNGHENTPRSQLESFTKAMINEPANKHIKSIVQTKYFFNIVNPHYAQTKRSLVNVKKEKMEQTAFNDPPIINEVMRINHYFTRSKEDWELKRRRGPGDGSANPAKDGFSQKYTEKLFQHFEKQDGVQNYDILDLIKRIEGEKNSSGDNNV